MTTMYQCDLSHGTTRTRAYIEARGAKVGARIRLTDSDDETQYWRVDSVSQTGIDKKYLEELKSCLSRPTKSFGYLRADPVEGRKGEGVSAS